jgi:hypothetical protein
MTIRDFRLAIGGVESRHSIAKKFGYVAQPKVGSSGITHFHHSTGRKLHIHDNTSHWSWETKTPGGAVRRKGGEASTSLKKFLKKMAALGE